MLALTVTVPQKGNVSTLEAHFYAWGHHVVAQHSPPLQRRTMARSQAEGAKGHEGRPRLDA